MKPRNIKPTIEAQIKRDTGIERSVKRANRVHLGWSDKALLAVKRYIRFNKHRSFLAEDIREWAEKKNHVSRAPDERSWGSVFRTAAKEGMIIRVGYAPARSSNLSPKCLWMGVI